MTLRDHGDPGDAPPSRHHWVMSSTRFVRRPRRRPHHRGIHEHRDAGQPERRRFPVGVTDHHGLLGGDPVLCVSHMAEHGRNLAGDRRPASRWWRASADGDPLAHARITLAGNVFAPDDDLRDAARQAHLDAVPAAKYYVDYSDFALWVLQVEQGALGGYGRMDSASGQDYAVAEADPVTPRAGAAIAHLNADHADSLALLARTMGGYPTPTPAVCTGADRYGLDLR